MNAEEGSPVDYTHIFTCIFSSLQPLLCFVFTVNLYVLFILGGLDVKSQEAALRAGPDILIATPGRLIDHLHNCPSFSLDAIEVLILDEADR